MATFIMMMGVPGCGKSYTAKSLSESYALFGMRSVILSSDAIREELFGDEAVQENPGKVFALLHKRLHEAINNPDIDFVFYDATNIKRWARMQGLRIAKPYADRAELIWLDKPVEECIANDARRTRHVGADAIRGMSDKLTPPTKDEGWDEIHINPDLSKWAGKNIGEITGAAI